ncbi:MAG TPA: hypothetical protein VGI65_09405 [Steroidobacteraceae bacterium]
MIKSATLVTVALLSFGLSAASIAADTGSAAPAAKSHKHHSGSSSKHHHKSHSTAAPTK